MTSLLLLRDDLRLSDHPALRATCDGPLLCVYVFEEMEASTTDAANVARRPLGGAARWWLHGSLAALDESLRARGGRLDLLRGDPRALIPALARAAGARRAAWSRRYEASARAIDESLKTALRAQGVVAESFNGSLLYEPWTVRTGQGRPFQVFTPFWRAARQLGPPERPAPEPDRLIAADWPSGAPARVALEDLELRPTRPDWAGGLRAAWTPGEAAAGERLEDFLREGLKGYADARDRPASLAGSRLSPRLRFGELSPRHAFHAASHAAEVGEAPWGDVEKFQAELGWREFDNHLLFHRPDLRLRSVQPRFETFPWRAPDPDEMERWRKGRTGFPLVDAGMRELWATGFMHNRVRMIVASFLVKNMLVDWRVGEAWFWDTLCDADPANNAANWQWVAGCGADAAPYFRIFNPVSQGEKFDPDGAYVRRWVPELGQAPARWIHQPWSAPPELRRAWRYPDPMLDLRLSRERALAALRQIGSPE
jgi:deoxyribodipyrimidine photo-lyase